MAELRATGPYMRATWLPRLLSGESSCEWASWFKAQHEGWSWNRMPSDFDQTGWLLNHTALLNQQRQKWEQQGYRVLTEGQNSFNLRGSSAVLAGKPDLVARRRDQITVIDAKTGRPSPAHTAQVLIYNVRPSPRLGTLQGAEHRRPGGLSRPRARHPGRCGSWEVRREPGRPHPPLGVAYAVQAGAQSWGMPVLRNHASRLPREGGRRSSGGGHDRRLLTNADLWELRAMEKLTLTLHKTKDTKNKVVYGTKDGSVIQSVYIDKDALGDTPPETIEVVLTPQ